MANFDLIGIPIPVTHPKFLSDKNLLIKIKNLEDLIEIYYDNDHAKRALVPLKSSFDKDSNEIHNLLGCFPFELSEMILSYIIIIYSKAFTTGSRRRNLRGETVKIFGENKKNHDLIINLRNKFYAHQEILANKYQIFCLPNRPDNNTVTINPATQSMRLIMAKSIELDILETCINDMEKYLDKSIEGLCKSIEKKLTKDQIKIINCTSKQELVNNYWNANDRKSPFLSR